MLSPAALGPSPARLSRFRSRGLRVESYRCPRAFCGVGHAVRIDEDGVAGVELKAYLPVFGVGHDSEGEAAGIGAGFLDPSISPPEQGKGVTRRAIGETPRAEFQHAQAEGNEHLLHAITVELSVEGGSRYFGSEGTDAVASLGGKLGHHHRRRDPLARDVAQDDGQAVGRQAHEVIVIAAHRVGRLVVGKELVTGRGRDLRHDPSLHLSGQQQLAGLKGQAWFFQPMS